jgi:hypothetical protein
VCDNDPMRASPHRVVHHQHFALTEAAMTFGLTGEAYTGPSIQREVDRVSVADGDYPTIVVDVSHTSSAR